MQKMGFEMLLDKQMDEGRLDHKLLRSQTPFRLKAWIPHGKGPFGGHNGHALA